MAFISEFRDKIEIKINEHKNNFTRYKTKESFTKNLDEMVDRVIADTKRIHRTHPNLEQEELKNRILKNSQITDPINSLKNNYIMQVDLNSRFIEIETLLINKDWGEKVRAFLLRVSTAIGIAAVILATGALAKYWEIPLPFRMSVVKTSGYEQTSNTIDRTAITNSKDAMQIKRDIRNLASRF